MKITLVMDQYGSTNNGTTVTAMRLCETLKKHGHTVRVITGSKVDGEDVFVVKQYHIPLFQNLIESQGMIFARPEPETIKKAIEGSDVVHFLMPFRLQKKTKKIADELGIPTTAAFHVQPENITSTLYLNKSKVVNDLIYSSFLKHFYRKFNHIHCPSNMIKKQLEEHNYQAKLHVISNGVSDDFKPIEIEKPILYKDKIIIVMVGRYSREKRQDLIIDAVKKSKYEKNIQLFLIGKGPMKDSLVKQGAGLTNPIVFQYVDQQNLLKILNYSDLYVHASDVEIEAISCIEAFSCGLVPIISNNELCATKQFALSEYNLFEHGDSTSLKDKIDFLIENKFIRDELSKKYIDYASQFKLDNCVKEIEKMFEEAIEEKKNEKTN
ncbi:MAG: glycosyltransferase [Bacilli bacterium]|nr:glycosyltransferase [Bacilli bacterium]